MEKLPWFVAGVDNCVFRALGQLEHDANQEEERSLADPVGVHWLERFGTG